MKFCPKCGKRTNDLIFDFCKECYFKDNDIIEAIKETNIEICENCKRIKAGNWARRKDKDYLEKEIIKNIKTRKNVHTESINVKLELPERKEKKKRIDGTANANIHAKIDGSDVNFDYEIPFSILYTKCPDCMKINNGYYEGELQLRPKKNSLFETVCKFIETDLESQKRFGVSLTEKVILPEGFDFQISKKMYIKTLAKRIVKRFGGTIEANNKLVSRDRQTSKDLLRLTVLVRLPEFETGDIILIKNRIIIVKKCRGNLVYGIDIENNKKTAYNYKTLNPKLISKQKNLEKDEEGNFTFSVEDKKYRILPEIYDDFLDDSEEEDHDDNN
jgi:nonsense-mediated mRNA decay protein 3